MRVWPSVWPISPDPAYMTFSIGLFPEQPVLLLPGKTPQHMGRDHEGIQFTQHQDDEAFPARRLEAGPDQTLMHENQGDDRTAIGKKRGANERDLYPLYRWMQGKL